MQFDVMAVELVSPPSCADVATVSRLKALRRHEHLLVLLGQHDEG